jgi:hypothetical protein
VLFAQGAKGEEESQEEEEADGEGAFHACGSLSPSFRRRRSRSLSR